MPMFKKVKPEKEQISIAVMVQQLDKIYSNKSGDEYKMHGDITASPVYNLLQRTIADLTLIKNLNKMEIKDLKEMFNVLHRPNFKKIVSSYIADKNPDAIIITATFTVAYRVLIGELSRIYTSTEATEKGFVYTPTRYSKKQSMARFIRNFNVRIDSELNKSIRKTTKKVKTGADFKVEHAVYQEGGTTAATVANWLADVLDPISKVALEIGAWCRLLFPDVTALNPVSWMSSKLSRSYDKKVNKFIEIAQLYEETKKAYDEYMKLPEFKRSKKVESKYLQNINKYNIKMQNAQAAISNYDERALKEAIEENKKAEEYAKTHSSDSSSSDSSKTTTDSSSSTSSSTTNDDPFDF